MTVPGTASATGRSPSPPPWRTCPSAPGSARWCTPCSRPPTSPRRTCAPSCCRCVRTELDRHPTPAVDPDALADALVPVARTPLGPLAAGRSLADLAPADRLAELDFELPLAGGDTPGADVAARRPRPAAAPPPARRRPARRLPGPARTASRPSRCAATSPAASTPCCACAVPSGSRSSTTRRTGSARSGRTAGSPCSPAHYTPDRLAAAMIDAHYPLQALLYSVALHRFLRWRLPRLRPGAPPRRRALPVPARHVRAGRPDGRRRALRGLLLAATRGARRRAVGPARPGRCDRLRSPFNQHGRARRLRASAGRHRDGAGGRPVRRPRRPRRHRGAGRVQRRRRARARRRARRRAGRAARRRSRGRRACSRWRWPSAGCGSGRCASTWPRSGDTVLGAGDELVDVSGCRGPTPGPGWRRVPRARSSPTGPAAPDGRPLRLVDGLLYLERYWRQEELVRTELAARADAVCTDTGEAVDLDRLRAALARLFGDVGDPREHQQRLAAAVAALRPVTVLAGGPGTGKTTTVARILALLRDRPGAPPRIALAAPTGKAAARLQEAVREAGVDDLPDRLHPAPAAGLAAGPQPVPPRPVRPAALRRDRRGRDVDGVADDDGPAARRGAPGRPAGAGRRPGPAGVGRGRRGPRRPRPRPRPSRTTPRRRPRGAGAAVRRRQRGRDAGPRLALPRCRRRVRPGRAGRRRGRGARAAARRHGRPGVRRDRLRGRPGRGARGRRRRRAARSPPPRGAPTCRRRWPRWSGTGCCAGTAAAPTAWPGGAARSNGGWPRRYRSSSSTTSGTPAARCS